MVRNVNFDIKQNYVVKIKDAVTGVPILLDGKYPNWINVTKDITIRHYRKGQAGVCEITFNMLGDEGVIGGRGLLNKGDSRIAFKPDLGSLVTVIGTNVESVGTVIAEGVEKQMQSGPTVMFEGFIHTIDYNQDGEVRISCYDVLYYFKNKVFFKMEQNMNALMVLKKIPDHMNSILGVGVNAGYTIYISPSFGSKYTFKYTLAQWEYGKSALDLINWILGRAAMTGVVSGTPLASYMNFYLDYMTKTIRIEPSEESIKRIDIVIGEGSLVQSYQISHSMLDVCNCYYVTYDSASDDKQMHLGIYKEKQSIAQLGELQKWQHFNAQDILLEGETGLGKTAINNIAEGYVKHYNKPTTKLTINAIGHCGVKAGYLIPVSIKGIDIVLDAQSKGNFALMVSTKVPLVLIDEVEHNITNDVHTMRIVSTVALNKYNTWSAVTKEEQP